MSENTLETYVSPLMSRLKEAESLTLETLRKYVPLVQAGNNAVVRLREETQLPRDTSRQLHRTVHEGERAKERLVLIALPLVKTLAYREFRRRQAWSSRVPFEEVVQEGIAGLLKGINAYNVDGGHKSPTNYIGQWVMTEIRRNVEDLEHDFSVPYETIERHRKIRAIRSRLSSELSREPTDAEIIEAAADSAGQYGDTKLGRVDKTSRVKDKDAPDRRRVITLKHLDEERDYARRTGAVKSTSLDTSEDGDASGSAEVATASVITSDHLSTDVDSFDSYEARKGLNRLLESAFVSMHMGTIQQDIIRRKFGLPPFGEEQTLKDICQDTKIPRHKVNKILIAFSQEMAHKGGPFHSLVAQTPIEDLDSMGMGWIINLLGPWNGAASGYSAPAELTNNLHTGTVRRQPRLVRAPPSQTGRTFIARYECLYEKYIFSRSYPDAATAPQECACPICGKPSVRVSD